MGVEYHISCPWANVKDMKECLEHSGFVSSYDSQYQMYSVSIGEQVQKQKMPDTYISFDEQGIYFCDNQCSDSGASTIFKFLVDRALRYSQGLVTIREA